ncbi:MAG: hypothetical protein D6689_06210 [Deltaproteobacteria bacterium]|nr:MAG: hypothetical protein D6689_06210 [Deltaproteobacteria bacterium]
MAHVTKTDRMLEDKMLAFAGDPERVDALAKARAFKRSWIDLAEALTAVRDRESYKRWGFDTFEAYCRKELHLKTATVHKLVGSYHFLRTEAPKVIERSRTDPAQPVPDLRAVDFVARATERGAADADTLDAIRRAAFDEGAEAPLLARRFREVAFPVSDAERAERLRAQIVSTARRMANLIAEPESPLPRDVAIQVEEAMGAVLEALDN